MIVSIPVLDTHDMRSINAMSDLVKCFSNSVLEVNLTTILIDMEPWFIAKEVATLLWYTNVSKAIGDHVDELDQRMLSRGECEVLFGQNITDSETVENIGDSRGTISVPLGSSTYVNPRGMKFINESLCKCTIVKNLTIVK